jgi:ornithine cyclodeaminase/alanine dehydrogenase-like protein (mu-crystallin family)
MSSSSAAGAEPVRILSRMDVEQVLDLASCIDAVETALRAAARDRARSAILGLHARDGGLHAKAAYLQEDDATATSWFVAKLNSNFPQNPSRHGLPTIQGVLALFDGRCGRLAALMDSSAVTVIRTAAATGVAARHLASPDASSLTIIGCGAQAFTQIHAVTLVRPIRRVVAIDAFPAAADRLATRVRNELEIDATARGASRGSLHDADIIITCTPSQTPFLTLEDVLPGTFIAAVGADNEDKSEIEPELMASADVVVDSLAQASTIGDLHHAIAAGLMTTDDVRGELGTLLENDPRTTRRTVIFDSTGVAVEDVAAAVLAFRRATAAGLGLPVTLGGY